MFIKNNLGLFWGGTFSQWYKSPIKIDGEKFNCCEQYMMFKKAELFNDESKMLQIMRAKEPKTQKKLGFEVENFKFSVWQTVSRNIVFRANCAKFTQNDSLYKEIKSYDRSITFVEASPYDKIWGIGLSENDERAWNQDTWQGLNYLGYIITEVRDIIS